MTTISAAEFAEVRDALPLLSVERLSTTFLTGGRPVPAVRGVSFSIARGETLVLLGESGSGKSVTARSILRLYGPRTVLGGRVLLDGVDLVAASQKEVNRLRGSRMGLVSQDPGGALDPVRRVGSQLREVLAVHKPDLSRAAVSERVVELLALVGLPDAERAARCYPHELSGGMRQRVVIALAVSCEPDLLIADEPTTALDVTVQAQILELIAELKARLGMGTLLVTHDVGVARQMADRVAVMYAGRIVEHGLAEQVLEDPVHPYTAALLAALPTPGAERGTLMPIPGRPPLAGELTRGCPFAPRCVFADSACRDAEPDLVAVGERGMAACIRPLSLAGSRA